MNGGQNIQTSQASDIAVAMVAYPGAHILDIVGPLEVLSGVGLFSPESHRHYRASLLARSKGSISTTSGLSLEPDLTFAEARAKDIAIDTLIVSGGHGSSEALKDNDLMAFITWAAQKARRVVSICTGAMLLAETGLLDGRRATTHWWWAPILARRYPAVQFEPDAIYVRDGNVWTSAGVTAGMDLALALVEEDFGHDVALQVARYNVMYMMRPGGQAQFSTSLIAQKAEDPAMSRVLEYVQANLAADLGVPALAAVACMSDRTFARKFKEMMGMTPASFVEMARLQEARVQLEQSDKLIDRVSLETGFGNAERMRRAFQRHLGISAGDYQKRFRPLSVADDGSDGS